jgi:uncharacterized protein (TIGR02145 family)
LRLPVVSLTGATPFQLDGGGNGSTAAGTIVYNDGKGAFGEAGIYVWNGKKWLPGNTPAEKILTIGDNEYTYADFGAAGTWMTENLREIPAGSYTGCGIRPYGKWYSYPDGSKANVAKYGYLYSWAAATQRDSATVGNTDEGQTLKNELSGNIQGVCPKGWHLPSDREWSQLEVELASDASSKYADYPYASSQASIDSIITADIINRGRDHRLDLKFRTATKIWSDGGYLLGHSKPANKGGFDALPAGFEHSTGVYPLGTGAYFWTSSSHASNSAWLHSINANISGVWHDTWKKFMQVSVRCKKD